MRYKLPSASRYVVVGNAGEFFFRSQYLLMTLSSFSFDPGSHTGDFPNTRNPAGNRKSSYALAAGRN